MLSLYHPRLYPPLPLTLHVLSAGSSCGLMIFYSWGRALEDAFDERKRTRLSSIIFRHSSLPERKSVHFEPVPDEAGPSDRTDGSTESGEPELTDLVKPLTKHSPNEIRYHEEKDGKKSHQERPTISVDEDLYLAVPAGFLELKRIPTMAIFHEQASNSHGAL